MYGFKDSNWYGILVESFVSTVTFIGLWAFVFFLAWGAYTLWGWIGLAGEFFIAVFALSVLENLK
jgi:hypothetical protein